MAAPLTELTVAHWLIDTELFCVVCREQNTTFARYRVSEAAKFETDVAKGKLKCSCGARLARELPPIILLKDQGLTTTI